MIPQIALTGDMWWSSAESIGRYFPAPNGVGGALARGGSRLDSRNAGVFTAFMEHTENFSSNTKGFRCAASLL